MSTDVEGKTVGASSIVVDGSTSVTAGKESVGTRSISRELGPGILGVIRMSLVIAGISIRAEMVLSLVMLGRGRVAVTVNSLSPVVMVAVKTSVVDFCGTVILTVVLRVDGERMVWTVVCFAGTLVTTGSTVLIVRKAGLGDFVKVVVLLGTVMVDGATPPVKVTVVT